jgi:hypothetical protein
VAHLRNQREGRQVKLLDYWKEVTGLVLSVIAGILTYLAKLGQNDAELTLYYSLIMAFVSHVFIAQVFRGFQLKSLEESLLRLWQTNNQRDWNDGIANKVASDLASLSAVDPVIAATARHAIGKVTSDIKIDKAKDKLEVIGRGYTLACYSKFWEALADAQRTRTPPVRTIARMTHTGDIASWLDEYNSGMSRQHRVFHEYGGRAFRLLIDPRERGSDLAEYIQFLDRMKADSVASAYISFSTLKRLFSPKYWEAEFCITDNPLYTVRWKMKSSKDEYSRRVVGLTLSRSTTKFGDHMIEWHDIVGVLEKVDYSQDTQDSTELASLEDYRRSFLDGLKELGP